MRLAIEPLAVALALLPAARAAAEASHHQGASPSQIGTAQIEGLARERPSAWYVRPFASLLTASEKFGGSGARGDLAAGGRVTNVGLNLLAEVRLGEAWAVSAVTGGQRLVFASSAGSETVTSLGDGFASGRFAQPLGWGSLAAIVTGKIPGTYPESEATGAKQVDIEGKLALAVARLGTRRLAAVVGIGHKVRLGAIEDEVTPSALLLGRLHERLTATALVGGGVAVGLGATPKDSLAAGAGLAWRAAPSVELGGNYAHTIFGHNVVDAHIATLGVGLSL
ncbi:MAG: hypothetical protein AABZ30_03445 [Myxococcota bacterium]